MSGGAIMKGNDAWSSSSVAVSRVKPSGYVGTAGTFGGRGAGTTQPAFRRCLVQKGDDRRCLVQKGDDRRCLVQMGDEVWDGELGCVASKKLF